MPVDNAQQSALGALVLPDLADQRRNPLLARPLAQLARHQNLVGARLIAAYLLHWLADYLRRRYH